MSEPYTAEEIARAYETGYEHGEKQKRPLEPSDVLNFIELDRKIKASKQP